MPPGAVIKQLRDAAGMRYPVQRRHSDMSYSFDTDGRELFSTPFGIDKSVNDSFHTNSVFVILNVASATALSYGHPLWLRERPV